MKEPRKRRGMILPLVMIGILLLLAMSTALQQAAWRSARGARTQWDAQRGLYAADAAVVQAVADWDADSMAASAIGVAITRTDTSSGGWRTRVALVRTGTLTAIAHAATERERLLNGNLPSGALGDPIRIRRSVLRAVYLEPPPIPLLAVATLLGDATLGSAYLDGRVLAPTYDPMREDCGSMRSYADVAALATEAFTVRGAPDLFGTTLSLSANALARARARFDSGFLQLAARSRVGMLTSAGTLVPSAPWRATVIRSDTGVTVDGTSTHVGLLVVDGNLAVRGELRVEGLLIVRGALDVSLGVLDVRGALIVRDRDALGSHLGLGTRVTYSPCLSGRALVAVTRPRTSPFAVWNSP